MYVELTELNHSLAVGLLESDREVWWLRSHAFSAYLAIFSCRALPFVEVVCHSIYIANTEPLGFVPSIFNAYVPINFARSSSTQSAPR